MSSRINLFLCQVIVTRMDNFKVNIRQCRHHYSDGLAQITIRRASRSQRQLKSEFGEASPNIKHCWLEWFGSKYVSANWPESSRRKFWPRDAFWPDPFREVQVLARPCHESPEKSRINHCSILGPKGLTGASAVPSGSKSSKMNLFARTLCYVLPGHLGTMPESAPHAQQAPSGEGGGQGGDGRKHLQQCSIHSLRILSVPLEAGSTFIQWTNINPHKYCPALCITEVLVIFRGSWEQEVQCEL